MNKLNHQNEVISIFHEKAAIVITHLVNIANTNVLMISFNFVQLRKTGNMLITELN